MEWLRKYVKKIKIRRKSFVAFQIEPTSRCQLKCIMCPRTVFSDDWVNVDMPLSVYKGISSHFHLVDDIHIQGWGEPTSSFHDEKKQGHPFYSHARFYTRKECRKNASKMRDENYKFQKYPITKTSRHPACRDTCWWFLKKQVLFVSKQKKLRYKNII